MRPGVIHQGTLGILAALLSVALVLGSLSMSLAEMGTLFSQAPSASPTTSPTVLPSATVTLSTLPATSMVTPATPLPPSPTATITPVPTLPPPPTNCPPPDDWVPITVQVGDTLESLARAYNTTERYLAQANCLVVDTLLPGTTLYVPRQPTPTPAPQCGPPPGWVYYVVQPGDTLFYLSRLFGVTVAQLQYANCLGGTTTIRAGERLFVPFILVRTSTPTRTATAVPAVSPTSTIPFTPTATVFVVPATPTQTATTISVFTPTATHTSAPTSTATNTAVPTPTATNTPVPTSTATNTAVPTPTATDTPVPTATATNTPLPLAR